MDKDKRPIDGQSYKFSKKRTKIDQFGSDSETSGEEQNEIPPSSSEVKIHSNNKSQVSFIELIMHNTQ